MGTAFVCSEGSVHHITDYAISVLGTGQKVVITHCNMAVRDMCKPTSGSRGWDLLGGCCEGRGCFCMPCSSLFVGICTSCAWTPGRGWAAVWRCFQQLVVVIDLCWPHLLSSSMVLSNLHGLRTHRRTWWSLWSSVTWVLQLSRSWVQPTHWQLFHQNTSCEKAACESLILN